MINRGHFVNNIALPKSLIIDDNLKSYIDASFDEVLTNLLGNDLLEKFKENPQNEIFNDFLNGAIFKVNGKKHKWQGLTGLPNLVALHTFCSLIKDNQIIVTSTGVAKSKVENSENQNALFNTKYIEVWNQFCDEYLKAAWFIKYNENKFPEWFLMHVYTKITSYGI